jgi:hypothetical protein
VLSVPLFTGSGDLSPTPLALKGADGNDLPLGQPRAVAVDGQGNLLVAGAKGLVRLKPQAGGAWVLDWQTGGLDLCAVAVSGDDVYVAEAGQDRVLRLDGTGKVGGQAKAAGDYATSSTTTVLTHGISLLTR